ncbi:MAG: PQQ-binding-like beta-propeller repeat protein [Planctomycetia bacterium]|nr:PQQ-binding-like beta-propeller repeat protein [Planctomycetia bacterium]
MKLRHWIAVDEVCWLPDSKRLVSSGDEGFVFLWDTETGRQIREYEADAERVTAIAVSSDGSTLATAGLGTAVLLWQVETGEITRELEGPSELVSSLRFSPDGKRVAGWARGNVFGFDTSQGDLGTLCTAQAQLVRTAAWLPSSSSIAVVDSDCKVAVWNLKDQRIAWSWSLPGDDSLCPQFSPDGKTLATADEGTGIRTWDVETGKLLAHVECPCESFSPLEWSPDGSRLAFAHFWTGEGRVMDSAKLETLSTFQTGRTTRHLAWSPDGSRIAAAGGTSIGIWDAKTGKCQTHDKAHGRPVKQVQFAGKDHLISTADDGSFVLWNVKKESPDSFQVNRSDKIPHSVFGVDETCYVIQTGFREAQTYDLVSGTKRCSIGIDGSGITSLALTSGGSRLVAATREDGLYSFDATTGKRVAHDPGSNANILLPVPDGTLVVAVYSADARIWDASTGRTVRHLDLGKEWSQSASLAPGGGQVTLSRGSGFATYDLAKGRCLMQRDVHDGGCLAVACSPDGRIIASGSTDCTVVLTDSATGVPLMRFRSDCGVVWSLAWTADGRQLASGLQGGTILVWDPYSLPPGDASIEDAWESLSSDDGARLWPGLLSLVSRGEEAVEHIERALSTKLPEADADRYAKWVELLGDDSDAEDAEEGLRDAGDDVDGILREGSRKNLQAGTRSRLDRLLAEFDSPVTASPVTARNNWAIRILEVIASRESLEALQRLEKSACSERVRRLCREALARSRTR